MPDENMMSTVSVIIPNYNYGLFLKEAIESALAQTLTPHEVIVIDDGSTDESHEIMDSFGDRVKTIRQKNLGVGVARNAGAEMATGEFLAFLDADDFWYPNKLEKQMQKFHADAEFGFVHCGLTNVDEKGLLLDEYLAGEEGWVGDALLKFQPAVIANTIIVKRELFTKVGGYDTNEDLHPSEDWDLCYRLSRECKVGFVREPLHYYRQHGRGGHTNIARMERAMNIGYTKAFADASPDLQAIRRGSYGNLYLVLSGSYFHAGEYLNAVRTGMIALFYHPQTFVRILGLPVRLLKRVSGAKTV